MYRKILNINNVENLQIDLNRLGNGVERNEMKLFLNKSKAVSFTRARLKDMLNYSIVYQKIPEASCGNYLGFIIRNDLSWADEVIYTVKKDFKALYFVMCIVKNGNKNTKI